MNPLKEALRNRRFKRREAESIENVGGDPVATGEMDDILPEEEAEDTSGMAPELKGEVEVETEDGGEPEVMGKIEAEFPVAEGDIPPGLYEEGDENLGGFLGKAARLMKQKMKNKS